MTGRGEHRGICVLGGPGIGKSTLALAVAHGEDMATQFGARRWFVRCDGASGGEALIAAIGNTLGLPAQGDRKAALMLALRAAPGLLVLDNVEAPWCRNREDTEHLLEELLGVAGLAVVLSLRAARPPQRGKWTTVFVHPLKTTDAHELFETLTSPALLADLVSTVDELHGHPDALRLFGLQARRARDLENLRNRWVVERFRLLRATPLGPEEGDLGAAIEVSARSPILSSSAPTLLAMLGLMPDGISHSDISSLLPRGADAAGWSLQDSGLAFEERGRVRLLAHVREHVASSRPLSARLKRRIVDHYLAVAAEFGVRIGQRGGADARARLEEDAGNIDVAFEIGLGRRDPRSTIDAILALTGLIRYVGIGEERRLQEALSRAKKLGDRSREGQALLALGRVAQARWALDVAEQRFAAARDLFAELGDKQAAADGWYGLAVLAHAREKYTDALALIDKAEALYRSSGWQEGTTKCLTSRGQIAIWHRNAEPSALLKRALAEHTAQDNPLGIAACIKELGDFALLRGDHVHAEKRYREAIPLFGEVDDLLGIANCHLRLSQCDVDRWEQLADQGKNAESLLDEAAPLYAQIGSRRNLGNVLQARADIARLRGEAGRADEFNWEAFDLFAQIPAPQGQAQALRRLAEGAVKRETTEEARELFERALDLTTSASDFRTIAAVRAGLARLSLPGGARREHLAQARAALVELGNEKILCDFDAEFGTGKTARPGPGDRP